MTNDLQNFAGQKVFWPGWPNTGPAGPLTGAGVVLLDATFAELAFGCGNDPDGATTAIPAYISYDGSSQGMHIACITASSSGSILIESNGMAVTGDGGTLDLGPGLCTLASGGLGTVPILLIASPVTATITPTEFDVTGGPYSSGSTPGVTGTLGVAATSTGGIVTNLGTPLGGTPITTTTALGQDLSGFLPNPLVVGLDGHPILFTSLSVNDILQWNGTDWVNAPAPSSTCIINDGGQVCVGSLGQITGTTQSGQDLSLTGGNANALLLNGAGDASVSCASGQSLTLTGSAGSGLVFDGSGNATLSSASSGTTLALDGSAGSSVVIDPSGAITLTGQAGSSMGLDASGDVFATTSAAGTLTLTGAGGAELLMDAGANVTLQSGTGGGMALYNGSGGALVWDTSGNATLSCFAGATLALDGTGGANVTLGPAGDVAATVGTGGSLTLTGGGAANLTIDPSGNTTLASWASGTLTLDGASGANLSMDASGDIAATTGSGGTLTLTGAGGAYFHIDAAGGIFFYPAAAQSIQLESNDASIVQVISDGNLFFVGGGVAGNIFMIPSEMAFLGPGSSSIIQYPTGQVILTSGAGGILDLNAAGGISLTPLAGQGVGAFGAAPAPQYTPAGVTAGWTAGSSLNFLQTDDTYTGGIGSSAYTIGDVVAALKSYGWLAP